MQRDAKDSALVLAQTETRTSWREAFWLAAVLVLWVWQLVASRAQQQWAAGTRAMCTDLPHYATLLPMAADADGRVNFATDSEDPEAAERFFCAQYALAPRVLTRSPLAVVVASPRPGPLLLDLVVASSRDSVVPALEARAASDGLTLSRVAEAQTATLLRLGRN